MRFSQKLPMPFVAFVVLAGALVCSASAAGAATVAKPFGIESFTMQTTERTEDVSSTVSGVSGITYHEFVNKPYAFTQAGGHPWALTTTGVFTSEAFASTEGDVRTDPTRDVKDVVVSLPPGLLGDPVAAPRCSLTILLSNSADDHCPADTQIGVYRLVIFGGNEVVSPIVNVTPAAGESAEFALEYPAPVFTPLLTAHLVRIPERVAAGGVRVPAEYGFTVTSNEIPLTSLVKFELTFWGVPADPSHDAMRGLKCLGQRGYGRTVAEGRGVVCYRQPELPGETSGGGSVSAGVEPVPFLSLGSDCAAGPETATMRADSWEEPGSVSEGHYTGFVEKSTTLPGLTGCNLLSFTPSIGVQPETRGADEPVGLGVNLDVPQNEAPEALATPHLRNAVVTLPEGLSISPGIVDGIQACNESGLEGINFAGPESEETGPSGELQLAAGHCPKASVVGTAEAVTPLLPEPVKGHVYLARPLCGGAGQEACTPEDALNGNLYQLYLELGGEGALANEGINIKAHGYVEANPATGQLTTKFLENPQAPFSELKIHLNGGPRAPLDNPAVCGTAVTTTDLTPWSGPGITPEGLSVPGTADATPSSFFKVEGCAGGVPPFAPGFVAGTVTPQAGQFSAFTMNLSRQDREQYVKGIQLHTPPGLLAMLASVPLCGEAEANDGHCPEASKLGTTRVASGAGSHPFEIEGTIYLTGPHDGAPFGLSIVTPAVAGPFNLGLVVVRARIDIDPEDSTATITTDETGPYAVPQILDGVPLRLKRVTVDIDRPGFMFNPTSCNAEEVKAVISGSQDAKAEVQSPLAVGGCKSLEFKPKFAVSTSGKTSKADGASLDAKLSYPAGSVGAEANIRSVKVDLPKQLPSRLTTLQKACTAQTFETDPAACPAASVIGIVRVKTPLLPVLLTGPVYFVSHGGEAFPSLEIVLQGDGVRVDVVAATFISKAGITSSTFKTVPDVPFESFEIYLPEGKYSALAANGNLCTSKLSMPTAFVAQNGAEIHASTKIGVTGCPKTKKAKAKQRKKKKKVVKSSRGGKK